VEVAHIVLGVVMQQTTDSVQRVPDVEEEDTRQVGVLVEVVQQMLLVLIVFQENLMKQML
tara:strand:+ start:146 stop:325 length:180 start_codon:yes stop_codon:yes gene_type:complete